MFAWGIGVTILMHIYQPFLPESSRGFKLFGVISNFAAFYSDKGWVLN